MKPKPNRGFPRDLNVDRLSAILAPTFVFLALWAVYLHTLNPAFLNDDSAETLSASWAFGVAHAPGYPLVLLLNHLFQWIPLGGWGLRSSLFAGFLAAFGAALLSAWVGVLLTEEGPMLPAAARGAWAVLAGLSLGLSENYWRTALSAKGMVYQLELVLLIPPAWALWRARREKLAPWTGWLVFGAALGLGHHWPLHFSLSLGVLAAWFGVWGGNRQPRFGSSPGSIRAPAWVLMALSPALLYPALRSHQHPFQDWGAADRLPLWWNYLSLHYLQVPDKSFARTIWEWSQGGLSGSRFSMTCLTFIRGQGLWISSFLVRDVSPVLVLAAILGWWRGARSARWRGPILVLALSMAGLVAANLLFNSPGQTDFLWILGNHLLPWDLAVALSGTLALAFFARSPRTWALAGLVVALTAASWPGRWDRLDQSRLTDSYRYGVDLLASAPRGSLLFAEEDRDYFAAYFLQGVEGKRPDLSLVTPFLWQESWGVAQSARLHPDWGLSILPDAAPWDRVGFNIRRAIQTN